MITLTIKSLKGDILTNAIVIYNDEEHKVNGKISIDTHNEIEITVKAEGYSDNTFTIKKSDYDIEKDVLMLPTKTVEEAVAKTVIDASPIIDAFIFNMPTTIDEAKQAYKNLDKNIKAQKDIIDKALEDDAMDILQAQATNLIYVAKAQLQPAMDYYVNARKQYSSNPFKSWVSFRNYMEYTSMIAGIYLLRANLTKYCNTILEKIQEKI